MTFNEALVRRDTGGKFDRKTHSAPEHALTPLDDLGLQPLLTALERYNLDITDVPADYEGKTILERYQEMTAAANEFDPDEAQYGPRPRKTTAQRTLKAIEEGRKAPWEVFPENPETLATADVLHREALAKESECAAAQRAMVNDFPREARIVHNRYVQGHEPVITHAHKESLDRIIKYARGNADRPPASDYRLISRMDGIAEVRDVADAKNAEGKILRQHREDLTRIGIDPTFNLLGRSVDEAWAETTAEMNQSSLRHVRLTGEHSKLMAPLLESRRMMDEPLRMLDEVNAAKAEALRVRAAARWPGDHRDVPAAPPRTSSS